MKEQDKKALIQLGAAAGGIAAAVLIARQVKGAPNPPPQPVKVPTHFISVPSGAEVYLDGIFIGNAPITLKLGIDSYSSTFIKPGYEDSRLDFDVNGLETEWTVTANMIPVAIKVWLNWQEEVLSKMSVRQDVTSLIRALYTRMSSDTSLAILAMTSTEQEMLRQNMINYLQNITYGNYTGPTDLLGMFGPTVFGLPSGAISMVFNGMNI